ncbi:MAG: hypothetical protein AABY27_02385 [Pseudomonadota bacterium]
MSEKPKKEDPYKINSARGDALAARLAAKDAEKEKKKRTATRTKDTKEP